MRPPDPTGQQDRAFFLKSFAAVGAALAIPSHKLTSLFSPAAATAGPVELFGLFVADVQTASLYTNWIRDNCGKRYGGTPSNPTAGTEAALWYPFRDAVLNGKQPSSPAMATAFGRSLIHAGELGMQQMSPIQTPQPSVLRLTGPLGVGATLTATPIYGAATYQWQRGNGTTWTDIGGATNPNYVTTSTDGGQYLRVRETVSGVSGYSTQFGPITTGGGGYSPQRWVYTLGDPAWQNAGFNDPVTGTSSTGWTRDAAHATSITPARIHFDDSVQVMQNITGPYGASHTNGPCHTCLVEIDAGDDYPTGPVYGYQGSVLRIDPGDSTNPLFGPMSDPRPKQGETWWYGYAMRTNAAFRPQTVNYEANSFGLEMHSAFGILGQLMTMIATGFLTQTRAEMNGAVSYWGGDPGSFQQISQPRIGIQLTAGRNDYVAEDGPGGTHTCRRAIGPVWAAGQLYKGIYCIKWDAYGQGRLQWWVDSTDGRGYIQYLDWNQVSTLWLDVATNTADANTYPQLLNYRQNPNDGNWPACAIYYGGFVKGSTMNDVVI